MLTMFDKQVQQRMGQANVRRGVDDILPLLGDDDRWAWTTSPPTTCRWRPRPTPTRVPGEEGPALKVVFEPAE
jgi:hypothetical protein